MKYTYYPGCSLRGTGKAYEESFLAVCKVLGIETQEVEDWNCCGATAYMSVDENAALALAGRNLAIAEGMGPEDMVVPCSGCFLTLAKSKMKMMDKRSAAGQQIRDSLKEISLSFSGRVQIRHPLDILVNDIGLDAIKEKVKAPLKGLKIAPYYGCQIVRPYATFDDQHNPVSMDYLFKALGARVVDYPLKTRCCGGSLTGTVGEVGRRLAFRLLAEARNRGADLLATVCPLCQFNLDCYQAEMSKQFEEISIPCVYFTQLMGLAFGLSPKEVGLQRNVVDAQPALAAANA